MEGISGGTPGAGGVDPARVDNSTGDASGTPDSTVRPTRRTTQPEDAFPGYEAGRHTLSSFRASSDSTEEALEPGERNVTELATAAARQRQDLLIREAASELMSLGFAPDQAEAIISRRSASGDALGALRKLPQLCDALGIEGHVHDEHLAEQQDLLREKLVNLIAHGGPDAMDALQNAYFNYEQLDAGNLADLLVKLGTYGHSYKQLADVGLRNADSLVVLRDLHQLVSRALSELERPSFARQLAVLADRGGVDALETLKRDILQLESHADWALYDVLNQALRASGLTTREIDALFVPVNRN